MRKQTAVLLTLLILSGMIAIRLRRMSPAPIAFRTPEIRPYAESSVSRESLFARDMVRSPTEDSGLPGFASRRERLSEKLINQTLPKLLADKEGSYTNLTDLLKPGKSRQLDINSDWMAAHLFPNRTLPLMSMRVIQDPDTGTYRISGGALTLPGTGLEAGYEAEFNRDERKATLQWKKSF